MSKKKYILLETHPIGEYEDKRDAEADAGNHSLWYPENSYKVIEEEVEDDHPVSNPAE